MNPWEKITLSDYENHMSHETIYQLQLLNKMMYHQFYDYHICKIMILGIAGGNGLEHIDPSKLQKVFGIDINEDYLETCKKRYSYLGNTLELIYADLSTNTCHLPKVDLIIANLLIEYIGYDFFCKRLLELTPAYVSVILQVNTSPKSFISSSPYLEVFQNLSTIHHKIDAEVLSQSMKNINYCLISETSEQLPNGKKLLRLDYKLLLVCS